MTDRPLLAIILAAGKGTRMKSQLPKVLHKVAGRTMLAHVLGQAQALGASQLAVVVGPDMDNVAKEARSVAPTCAVFVQTAQKGTGDAVKAARQALEAHSGDVIVLFGDTPLLTLATLKKLRSEIADMTGVAVLGFHAQDPTGYGRLLTSPLGELLAIREHKDASGTERQLTLCNSGVLGFSVRDLPALLDAIQPSNIQGEYYLTDTVELARKGGHNARVVIGFEREMLGVNSRAQLAEAEAEMQRRLRTAALDGGVTMIDPQSVYLSADTRFGQDVVIEPNVFFGPGVTIGSGVEIKANCHIEGATIANGARVGPFARLRPGAKLKDDVHVGNFVEIKNATLDPGAKANHLAYIGDGHVGEGANIGAGTIFCNYDGFNKHRTEVGPGAFVGSNSSLVAPVKIGAGAYVGSGSVITKDVAPDALAVERAQQMQKDGWAAKFRIMMQRRKNA
jgi:bifunctional UDP-N-acetylglucosamine pyrophosphorylase / glucosamine-1-phosphate N-acetyltransferase